MGSRETELREFFARYGSAFNRSASEPAVAEEILASYCPQMLAVEPGSIQCVHKDAQFVEAIAQGWQIHRDLGMTALELTGIELTPLTDADWMAYTHWTATFPRPNAPAMVIPFDFYYFVRFLEDLPAIFAFISVQDERALLRSYGLEFPTPAETSDIP